MRGPTAPSRVLFVIDNLECGGAQQLLVPFTRELRRRGSAVTVCALQPRAELAPRLEAAGARVLCLGRTRPSILNPPAFLGYLLGNLRALLRLAREPGTVLSAHLSDAEFLGICAGLLGRVPVTVTVHAQRLLPPRAAWDPRNALRRLVTRLLFNRAQWVVAVSTETAALLTDLFGVGAERVRVILNGIDAEAYAPTPALQGAGQALRQELGIPAESFLVCSIARLTAQKNLPLAIRAVAWLMAQGHDLRLLLAGDGPLRGELQDLVRSLGLERQVLLLGFRDDVPRLLGAADAVLSTSDYEGTSLALLEAMAGGKPVVATDIPGNDALLRHGENGLLAPPGDAEALGRELLRLMTDPELRAQLGQAAADTVRRAYGMETMVDAYAELWNSPGP